MSLWFAALLGLVQGLTEFLPVSSTAHLRIVPDLLGQPDPGAAFTAVIQLGTLAAVTAYFLKEIGVMLRALLKAPRSPDARLALYIVAGTVPIGLFGLLFKSQIKNELRSLYVVAIALIVVGVVMAIADRAARQRRGVVDLTLVDALLIGLGQACALVPGVSRSGATLTVALLLGLRRADAARFSFLLSVPAIAAAGIFELKDALHEAGGEVAPLVVGTAVAFVSGYAAIKWFLAFLRARSLVWFSIYRVVVGIVLLITIAAGG